MNLVTTTIINPPKELVELEIQPATSCFKFCMPLNELHWLCTNFRKNPCIYRRAIEADTYESESDYMYLSFENVKHQNWIM